MITILTTFKPFCGEDSVRQINALFSWFSLDKNVEVFAFGDSPGTAKMAFEYNFIHYPQYNWNCTGIPTIKDIFSIGQKDARNDLIAFVNGDIVLGAEFLKAISSIHFDRFLATGERWDSDYFAKIESISSIDVESFRRLAKQQGRLRGVGALDYFAFRRGTLGLLPELVPGGKMWDNYMVHYCWIHNIPVVDISNDVLAIHQNHGYKKSLTGKRLVDDGPGTKNNVQIAQAEDPYCCVYTPGTTYDASHFLIAGKLRPFYLSPRRIIYKFKKVFKRSLRNIVKIFY